MRWSKSSLRMLEDVQLKLRQHCKLQDEKGGARCRDSEKPLRDPRNQICAVHVCILID
jgi:hypothetical protein